MISIDSIPLECLLQILILLDVHGLFSVQSLCKSLYDASHDNHVWFFLCMEKLKGLHQDRCARKPLLFGEQQNKQDDKMIHADSTYLRTDWKLEYNVRLQNPRFFRFLSKTKSAVRCVRHLAVKDDIPAHFKVASGDESGQVSVWDTLEHAPTTLLGRHAGPVVSLCGGGNGPEHHARGGASEHLLFSASEDALAKLWDLHSGQLVRTFEGHKGAVVCCAEKGEQTYVTGSGDSTLRIWDARSPGGSVSSIVGHDGTVLSVIVIDHEGKFILSSARDETLRIWDTRTCSQLKVHHTSGPVRSTAYSSESGTLVTGGGYSRFPRLYVYNSQIEETLRTSQRRSVKFLESPSKMLWHADAVCALTGDNVKVIAASFDSTIKMWDRAYYGECLRTLHGHTKMVTGVHLNRRGDSFVSGGMDGQVRVWFWPSCSGAALKGEVATTLDSPTKTRGSKREDRREGQEGPLFWQNVF